MKVSLVESSPFRGHARETKALAVCALALTLLLVGIVATGVVPLGASSVIVYEYGSLQSPSRALFGLIPLLAMVFVVRRPGRSLLQLVDETNTEDANHHRVAMRRTEIKVLLALWLAAFGAVNAVALMHPMGWAYPATLVVNPASNSYFSTALHQSDLGALLRDYPRAMKGFASHAQTQSAGPVVFSHAATTLARASPLTPFLADTLLALSPGISAEALARYCRVWEPQITEDDVRAALCVAFLMIALSSLTVVPIYFLGKWIDSAGAGLCAALSLVVLPSFVLFSPSFDQMYPLITATALCALWRGVSGWQDGAPRALWWVALAGICLGAGLFFNLGLIVAVFLCALVAFFVGRREKFAASWWLRGGAVFTGGVLLVPLLLKLFWGYDLWAVFLTSNHLRDVLYYNSRSYAASLWANPLDFFTFCGTPLGLLWLWQSWKSAPSECASRQKMQMSWAMALLVAFVVTLLLLDFSGRTRGEVARMWLFLTPPLLIGAGAMAFRLWRTARPTVALLLVLQWAQLLVFQYFVRVWGY